MADPGVVQQVFSVLMLLDQIRDKLPLLPPSVVFALDFRFCRYVCSARGVSDLFGDSIQLYGRCLHAHRYADFRHGDAASVGSHNAGGLSFVVPAVVADLLNRCRIGELGVVCVPSFLPMAWFRRALSRGGTD